MKKKFTIEVETEERWIDHFCSMLKYMEYLGAIGASRSVVLYSDGDGDFRPNFNFNIDYEEKEPTSDNNGNRMYDAG